MVPTSTTWRMADRLAEGNLEATLLRLSADGRNSRQISEDLAVEHPGVEVTHVTVRNWLAVLSQPESEHAS